MGLGENSPFIVPGAQRVHNRPHPSQIGPPPGRHHKPSGNPKNSRKPSGPPPNGHPETQDIHSPQIIRVEKRASKLGGFIKTVIGCTFFLGLGAGAIYVKKEFIDDISVDSGDSSEDASSGAPPPEVTVAPTATPQNTQPAPTTAAPPPAEAGPTTTAPAAPTTAAQSTAPQTTAPPPEVVPNGVEVPLAGTPVPLEAGQGGVSGIVDFCFNGAAIDYENMGPLWNPIVAHNSDVFNADINSPGIDATDWQGSQPVC